MSCRAVPGRAWFARLRRAGLAASLAIAPLVLALMMIVWVDRSSAFHCLLIRTSASSGIHVELSNYYELAVTGGAREESICNGPPLQPGEWMSCRHGVTHPAGLRGDITYWGRFGEAQALLLSEYRGGPSFLWVRLVLIELLIPSLLVWLVVVGRWLFRTRRIRLRGERGFFP